MHKLLLVEDNELNSDALGRLLARRGFTMLHAPDGLRALEIAERERPDLVLLDIGLPGMDGHEVARELRLRPATAKLPIIALTAHATAADRKAALESGCDDFEVKPVSMARLVPLIETLLARRPL
ncbi:MAG TPA: response regulator [Holophagaceae bacterium]|jgi:two-component system cell cycle response regulator DivK|nr:response regulator [Holophagaceae bacterium]